MIIIITTVIIVIMLRVTLRRSRSRLVMPPILATREQVPTAWFLITVGNISAV